MSRIFKAGNVNFDDTKTVKLHSPIIHREETETEQESEKSRIENFINDAFLKAERIVESAKMESAVIIEDARDRASKSIEDAKAEIDAALKNAEKTGYDNGYKKGVKDSDKLRKDAQKVLDNAKKERLQILDSIEGEIVDLVISLVSKLSSCYADIDKNVIVCLIRQGLSESTLTGDVKIRVSKDDFDAAIENKEKILEKAAGISNVDIIKDLSLNKNDCIIETIYGNIDCSLDQQYQNLRNNLYYLYESSRRSS